MTNELWAMALTHAPMIVGSMSSAATVVLGWRYVTPRIVRARSESETKRVEVEAARKSAETDDAIRTEASDQSRSILDHVLADPPVHEAQQELFARMYELSLAAATSTPPAPPSEQPAGSSVGAATGERRQIAPAPDRTLTERLLTRGTQRVG
jgi:hypothetical protein